MGGQQSHSEQFLQEFQQQCQRVRDVNDVRFGEISIYRNAQQYIMVKSQWCNNEQEYTTVLAHCERRSKLQHPNLIKLLGFHSNQSTQLCGDFSKVTIYLEFFDQTLEKSLIERRQAMKYFTEAELWKMLYTIVKLGAFLDLKQLILGDIRPCNIQLGTDLKMAEFGIIPHDQNGLSRSLYNHERVYLAPEVTQSSPLTSRQDVFSLGITMLECSTLSQGSTDVNEVQRQLDQTQGTYSQTWFKMLREMLRNIRDRPSYQDINDALRPFEQQIMNLQPFALVQQQPSQLPQIQPQIQPQPPQPQRVPQIQSLPQPSQIVQQYQPQASLPQQFQQPQQYQPQSQITQPQQFQQPTHQYTQSQYQQQSQYVPQNQSPQLSQPVSQVVQQPQIPKQLQTQLPQSQISQLQYQQQQQYAPQIPQYQQQVLLPQQTSTYQPQTYQLQHSQSQPYYQPQPVPSQVQKYNEYYDEPLQSYIPSYAQIQTPQPMQHSAYYEPHFEEQSPIQGLTTDDGLSEIDKKIQRALMMTRETEMRNQRTPNY